VTYPPNSPNPPQNPLGHNPFGGVPFGAGSAGPPVFTAPPAPPPHGARANTLATLSLVFAFVFAPVGAILGHLGLRQIRRTGEPGRERAIAGMMVSYAVILVAVVALVVFSATASDQPSRRAAPTSATTPRPSPTVAPADLAGLIPGLADVKTFTGDQNMTIGPVHHRPNDDATSGQTLDRPECWGTLDVGLPNDFNGGSMLGFYLPVFEDSRDPFNAVSVAPVVAAYIDAPAAQAQLTKMLSNWRQCTGSNLTVTVPNVPTIVFAVNGPKDAGNGISTEELVPQGLPQLSVHAMAVKANVVIDLLVSYTGKSVDDRARQATTAVANYVLGKIPG
jgi:eukaryotic-like serine/threonine-protein kinase